MGMIANYQSTTDTELEKFMCLDDVEEAQENENLEICDIDKMWDALHFLLTGKSASEPIEDNLISEAIVGQFNISGEEIQEFISGTKTDRVKEIAKALNTKTDFDVQINAVCIDTRKITKGCLFICIKGERFDAHQFANEALSLGAAAVMISEDIEVNGAFVKVENTSKALLDLSAYYRSKFDIPVVALTGSVGKTTTKEFTYLVVNSEFNAIKTQGNLNNEIGLPQMLFQIDNSTEAAVIEMGMNHFGEIHRLVTATKPTLAMITNIGVSHIENLGSREGILKSKLEILDGLEAGSPFIINVDNDMLKTILDKDEIMEKYDVITFGIESESANYKAKNIKEENGSTSFDVEYTITKIIPEIDGVTAKVYLCSQHIVIPTIGIHNVYNALAAFAVGITLGIDTQKSADALSNYVPAGMRQKSVTVGGIS